MQCLPIVDPDRHPCCTSSLNLLSFPFPFCVLAESFLRTNNLLCAQTTHYPQFLSRTMDRRISRVPGIVQRCRTPLNRAQIEDSHILAHRGPSRPGSHSSNTIECEPVWVDREQTVFEILSTTITDPKADSPSGCRRYVFYFFIFLFVFFLCAGGAVRLSVLVGQDLSPADLL